MVMNQALRFYPPNNVSVRSEFYMFRKGAAGESKNALINPGAPEN